MKQNNNSTLDPVLRKELGGPSWQLFALLGAAALYLFATPGVLPGAYDYYVGARLQQRRQRAVGKSDLSLGRKLGSGAFGSAFKATLAPEEPGGEPVPVIVKKAKEFGEAEAWMNERMARAAPGAAAGFVAAFEEGRPPSRPPSAGGGGKLRALLGGKKGADNNGAAAADAEQGPDVWLVFNDEGDFTLWDLMQSVRSAAAMYVGCPCVQQAFLCLCTAAAACFPWRLTLAAAALVLCLHARSIDHRLSQQNVHLTHDQTTPNRSASPASPTTSSRCSSAVSCASPRAPSAACSRPSSRCASSSRRCATATRRASCTATSSRRTPSPRRRRGASSSSTSAPPPTCASASTTCRTSTCSTRGELVDGCGVDGWGRMRGRVFLIG